MSLENILLLLSLLISLSLAHQSLCQHQFNQQLEEVYIHCHDERGRVYQDQVPYDTIQNRQKIMLPMMKNFLTKKRGSLIPVQIKNFNLSNKELDVQISDQGFEVVDQDQVAEYDQDNQNETKSTGCQVVVKLFNFSKIKRLILRESSKFTNTTGIQTIDPQQSVYVSMFPTSENDELQKIVYELEDVSEKALQIVYNQDDSQTNSLKIKFDSILYNQTQTEVSSTSTYWTFPPPTSNFQSFKLTYPAQCQYPRQISLGIFQFQTSKIPERQKTIQDSSALRQHWMQNYYPLIKQMKIPQMALLSAHDSASSNFYNIIAQQWAVTQNENFITELRSGVRVLDLRLCQQNLAEQFSFKLCHSRFQTTNSLVDALRQVKQFIQQNPNELIILDLHQTKSLNYGISFNHQELDKLLRTELDQLFLKASDARQLSLQKIMESKGRISVAYRHGYRRIDSNLYMNKIKQVWTRKVFICYHTIQRYFNKVYEQRWNSVGGLPLWSASINLYLFPTGPSALDPGKLQKYYVPGEMWMDQTQIVQIDFVEESYLIYQFIFENVKRAFVS